MVFNQQLQDFFASQEISNYFDEDISNLFRFKTNETFKNTTLNKFIELSEKLENSLIAYSQKVSSKVDYQKKIYGEFEKNNEKMRELNEQICLIKIETKSFKERLKEETGEVIEDLF